MAEENTFAAKPGAFAVSIGLTAGFLAIFFLPLHIPMSAGFSDAYLTGFNLRACLLVMASVFFGVAFWTGGLGLVLPEASRTRKLGRPILYGTLAITAGSVLGVWWLMRSGVPANEAHYFADRYIMYQSGASLYREIEFPYGPFMFYLPLGIRWLTHLSLTDSYFIAWTMQWLAGIWVLWCVVDLAVVDAGKSRTIYLLLWGFFLPAVLDAGPNYTPLRFSSALLFALVVQRLYAGHASAMPAFGLASVGYLLLLFYSPEQGIGFSCATAVYFLINIAPRRKGFVAGIVLFLTVTAGGLVIANNGELNSIRQFSNGGFAFPLVLSLQNVVLLLILQAAVCGVWGTLRRRKFDNPLLYLCLLAGSFVPSAFGRCDTGHMVLNLMGALLTGFIVLAPYRTAWRWVTCSFLLLVIVGAVLHVYNGRGLFLNAMRHAITREGATDGLVRRLYFAGMIKARGEEKARHALATLDAKPAPGARVVYDNAHDGRLLAPFGQVDPSFEGTAGTQILSGRYAFLFPLLGPVVPAEKINELQSHAFTPLLLPEDDSLRCSLDTASEREILRHVLTPLYLPPFIHKVTVAEPLCAYIKAHYQRTTEPSPQIGYQIWNRIR